MSAQPPSAFPPSPAPNPGLCPLCGQTNACAQVAGGGPDAPCWCQNVTFSAELLAQVPDAQQGVSCICTACADKAGNR